MKRILYFQASGKVSARQKLEGVYAYGHAHGWDVQVIESGARERKANELVAFWSPDGILVECGSEQNHFNPAIFGKMPVVFLDRNPKTLAKPAFCVVHDSIATARLAARELLSLKLAAYAYVPWPEPRFWSEERESGFAEALKLNDRGYSCFSGKARTSDIRSLQKELGDWLAHLPKPVGIFAANDFMAAQVAAPRPRNCSPTRRATARPSPISAAIPPPTPSRTSSGETGRRLTQRCGRARRYGRTTPSSRVRRAHRRRP